MPIQKFKSFIAFIVTLGGVIGVFVFATGYTSLPELLGWSEPAKDAGQRSNGSSDAKYSYINAGTFFLDTAIPASVSYTSYDWLSLQTQSPGVVWAGAVEVPDTQACRFSLKGDATFSINRKPDIWSDGITPTSWTIHGCGVRTMVFSVSAARRVSFDDMNQIAMEMVKDLNNQGFEVSPIGCLTAFGFYDYFEYFELRHPAKRTSILEIYLSRPAGGTANGIDITNHLYGSLDQVIDRHGFARRPEVVKQGCELADAL